MSQKFCKNCMISSKCPHTTIDEENVCNFCRDVEKGYIHSYYDSPRRQELAHQLDQILKSAHGKDYDCLVGFSGGKDSTYLLYKLRKDYPNLRILAVTINLLLSRIGAENVASVVEKMDIDHISIFHRRSFYKKFYKYLLEHRPMNGYGYKSGLIWEHTLDEKDKGLCFYCTEVMHGTIYNYACEKQIPVVILGYTHGQCNWIQLEENLQEDTTPFFMNQPPFTEEDRSYCWNPKRYPIGTQFPHVLYPYHVWDYSLEAIKETLLKEGLVTKRTFSPAVTNCYLNFLMCDIDFKVDGYFNMLPYVGYLVRHGLGGKGEWKKISRVVNLISPWLFHPTTKKIADFLGVNVKELIDRYKNEKQKT